MPVGGGLFAPIGTGLCLTLAILVLDTRHVYNRHEARTQPLLALPPMRTLGLEAAPHIGYGAFVMLLLLSPHAVALAASPNGLADPTMFQFELAANLSLIPLLAATPYTERLLRVFWTSFVRLQVETPADRIELFSQRLETSALRAVHRISIFLAGGSLLVIAAVEILLRASPQLREGLHVGDLAAFESTLGITLIAYGMIGRGYLEVAWAFSLGRPSSGLVSAAAGAAVTLVAAPIVAAGPLATTAIATLFGSTSFATISAVLRKQLFEDSAHDFVVMD
jgi:hypothetical protein